MGYAGKYSDNYQAPAGQERSHDGKTIIYICNYINFINYVIDVTMTMAGSDQSPFK